MVEVDEAHQLICGSFCLCSNSYIFGQGVAKFDQWGLPGWNHSEQSELYCADKEKGVRTKVSHLCFLFFFPFRNTTRLFVTVEIDSLKCTDVPTLKEHADEAGYCDPNV